MLNRTTPPVARKFAERPAAPPVPVLVGDAVPEERLLVEDEWEEVALVEVPVAREEEAKSGTVGICGTQDKDATYRLRKIGPGERWLPGYHCWYSFS